jgi:hypothetical protein
MSWFNFLSTLSNSGEITTQILQTKYPPVRRKINFPILTENLKAGDWLYVPLGDLQIGKVFSYDNGIVQSVADKDSYLVTYETSESFEATYSYIDDRNNLYFRSITDISSGSLISGNYYIYYHYNNLQMIQLIEEDYVQSEISINGFNAFENGDISSESTINKYSNVVLGSSENDRVYSLSYISSPGLWVEQESDNPGNKVIGTFDGPLLKVYGRKGSNCGQISLKIIKTSSTGVGQSIILSAIIDLYSNSSENNAEIYSIDITPYMTEYDQDELYKSFVFEIEILNSKNVSSSGKKVKITKYSFSKNYSLSLENEEIYQGITFASSGVIR